MYRPFMTKSTKNEKNVPLVKEHSIVNDFAPTRFHDLLVLQVALPPAAVLESIRVEINMDDPIGGTVSMDEDPNFLGGSKYLKKEWRSNNQKLTSEIEAMLDLAWKGKYVVEGTTPLRA
jgi:hypothetical protein